MSLSQARRTAETLKDEAPARYRNICAARGCPLRPVADTSTGTGQCTVHAGAEFHDWPRLTDGARANEGLGQLIGEIQRLAGQSGPRSRSWQELAVAYWTPVDQFCLPSADELTNVNGYLYRMFGELNWRAGRSKNRPRPRDNPNKAKPSRPIPGYAPVAEAQP